MAKKMSTSANKPVSKYGGAETGTHMSKEQKNEYVTVSSKG